MLLRQNPPDFTVARRHLIHHHISHNVIIDAKIAVNQAVTHPGDCTRFNYWILLLPLRFSSSGSIVAVSL